jgi:hypothetical protein
MKKEIWIGVGVIALASYLLYKSRKKSFTGIEPKWATQPDRIGVPIILR